MGHKGKKHQEEESGESAPLWIISFADMISLLMAFFVMLSTFSSFGPNEEAKLSKIVHSAISPNFGLPKKTFRAATGYKPKNSLVSGPSSQKPSSEEESNKEGSYIHAVPKDIRDYKIFLVESSKLFWSTGSSLTVEGRDYLSTLAELAKKHTNRILISEHGSDYSDDELGLTRAITVMNYMVNRGIAKDNCNIGIRGMLPDENFESERMLEITLLDKNIYK